MCCKSCDVQVDRFDNGHAGNVLLLHISRSWCVNCSQNVVQTVAAIGRCHETEQRCMRAQGKTDLINGALVWALSCGQDFPRAMGLSCLAWVAAITYSDFVADKGTSRSEAIRQLLIAGVTAGILL
mmetsp:Transcript_33134/g.49930  ORF Transcript_33134/g.49930 Transcript_33134/m.49930 type:complete len:126 (+) Transcript_33134:238-615(+)